jgi:hypothetical protein
MASHVTYTNRRDQTFYLHQRCTRNGKICYRFIGEPGQGGISKIPEGYEIVESVNGVVSLRKIKPRPITDLELGIVRRVLEKHPHLHRCRMDVKGKTIYVYEARKSTLFENTYRDSFLGWCSGWTTEKVGEYERRNIDYDPVMRFVLVDRKARLFRIERMCYHSWHDGWLSLKQIGTLEQLAEEFLPHITRESFYELWPY